MILKFVFDKSLELQTFALSLMMLRKPVPGRELSEKEARTLIQACRDILGDMNTQCCTGSRV